MYVHLPLILVAVLLLPVALAPVSRRMSLLASQLAVPIFGRYVGASRSRRTRQIERLRAARVEISHRLYASRTLLYSAVFGVAGSVLGVYAGAGALVILRTGGGDPEQTLPNAFESIASLVRLSELGVLPLFAFLLLSSALLGAAAGIGAYWLRWALLDYRAAARARRIDATLPRTVAFVYALSRSGMSFPTVLETLTAHSDAYGESGSEFDVAVTEMTVFGTDVLTALQRMSDRTPSENMREFGENLASVLGSGRSLSSYLHEQYDRYQDEAEARQSQYLELLSTFAEIYVTALVAGPLFLITVLVVIGLALDDTLTITRIVSYVLLPAASLGFIAYIRTATGMLEGPSVGTDTETIPPSKSGTGGGGPVEADGGTASSRWLRNRERLRAYDRISVVRRWIGRPLETVLADPAATLAVTVPLGLAWLGFRTGSLSLSTDAVSRIDRPLIESTLFVFAGYALVYEIKKRRVQAIEDAVPDFLDRLASSNEAGATVVGSVRRVRGSDLDALDEEIDRLWRDLQWGADIHDALERLDRRTGSVAVGRAVTLLSNAMRASGDVAPVLRIAADEAQNHRRLRRERRQEMFAYLLVIYISFLVFLGIIAALSVAFIPAVNEVTSSAVPASGDGAQLPLGSFGSIRQVNTEAYAVLFSRVSAIQAVCSGLIAGLLGEGNLRDGVKHAFVLLTFAYGVFVFV